MKRILFLGLAFLVFVATKAQSDPSLNDFGRKFLAGLAEGNRKDLDPIRVSEQDVLPTLQAAGFDEEQQQHELETFRDAQERMEASYSASFTKLMEAMKDKKLNKATLVEVRRERPLEGPLEAGRVDKSDLLIIFNIKDDQFVIDVDDCVHTSNGWRFTAKFHLDSLDN